jgi:hypothetical protein
VSQGLSEQPGIVEGVAKSILQSPVGVIHPLNVENRLAGYDETDFSNTARSERFPIRGVIIS